MAPNTPVPGTNPEAVDPIKALAAAIVEALRQSNGALADSLQANNAQLVEAINAAKPKVKITIANRIARNPMNPKNDKRVLPMAYYQNFHKIDPQDLTPDEYELLPRLKEGNFVEDGREGYLVEVIHVKRGAHRGMHIRYNNKTTDQQMQFMVKVGSDLSAILRKCIAEYEKQKVERKRRKAQDEDED